jgi:hypothetical protein
VSGLFDPAQWLADTQAAMRALWPDRPMVYLQDKPGQDPAVPVLTDDERGQLTRVADAIKAARELPVDTVAVPREALKLLIEETRQLDESISDDRAATQDERQPYRAKIDALVAALGVEGL